MPRLFTGLEIPSDVMQHLSSLRGGLPGARWIDTENYHITLRFIGDIDHATARDIFTILGDCRRNGEIDITISEISSFGGDRPHSVFAKVQLTPALAHLQAEQERLLRRIGLSPETRKFSPHVTLARVRNSSALDIAHYISLFGSFPKLNFRAKRFVLLSSKDSVGGGPYVVEAAYPLA